MAAPETTTPTVPFETDLNAAVRMAAGPEHRSVADLPAPMIRNFRHRVGVAIPERGILFDQQQRAA